MNVIDLLLKIDRRIIYLILVTVVVIPLLIPSPEKVRVMLPVEKLYEAVDEIPDDKALIIDFVYTPQLKPELEPMAFAVLRHAFKRGKKVLALSLFA
ncbi:MAG TPA: hypothetical protein EYP58_03010, partial [bacterium (Candidatus Stahlbacteria)]|nr:hypothetical protein [Candidatus Stahlbacteria bacterium]